MSNRKNMFYKYDNKVFDDTYLKKEKSIDKKDTFTTATHFVYNIKNEIIGIAGPENTPFNLYFKFELPDEIIAMFNSSDYNFEFKVSLFGVGGDFYTDFNVDTTKGQLSPDFTRLTVEFDKSKINVNKDDITKEVNYFHKGSYLISLDVVFKEVVSESEPKKTVVYNLYSNNNSFKLFIE